MTAAEAALVLENALRDYGRAATLKRRTNGVVTATVELRAHITDYAVQDIAGSSLQVGSSKVILAASQLGGVLPKKGDILQVDGRARSVITAWEAPRVDDTLVRVEMAIE